MKINGMQHLLRHVPVAIGKDLPRAEYQFARTDGSVITDNTAKAERKRRGISGRKATKKFNRGRRLAMRLGLAGPTVGGKPLQVR